jgi:ribosomal protein S18 acetylase RimI-like enzyme
MRVKLTLMDDPHLRPLDHSRDLMPVADLIEECFRETIDPDGLEYLSYLRDVARQEQAVPGWALYTAQIRSRFDGYVWEDNGKIVGNVTLLPARKQGKRIFLIANVAVKPEYRSLGIGRKLTARAMAGVRERKGSSAWLQVREDNPLAHGLYLSMGFSEKACRTTWVVENRSRENAQIENGYSEHSRKDKDWPLQRSWLEKLYPSEVNWNLPFREELFLPGFLRGISRALNGEWVTHWVIKERSNIQGFITWQSTRHYYDLLWPALAWENSDELLDSLLRLPWHSGGARKPVAVNYPAGKSDLVFLANGFTRQATLVWMESGSLDAGES